MVGFATLTDRVRGTTYAELFAKRITLDGGSQSRACRYERQSTLKAEANRRATQYILCCTAQRAEGTIPSPVSPAQNVPLDTMVRLTFRIAHEARLMQTSSY